MDGSERSRLKEEIEKLLRLERPNTILSEIDRETGRLKQESFSDFGQEWIDKVIKRCLPSAKVCHPLVASALYGEFFHEFDTWRSAANLSEMKSYQGVLAQSPDLRTACLRLVKRDTMTDWYGRQFDGNTVAFFALTEA